MTLNKMEASSKKSEGLQYFQNLIPGTKDSPFIDRYKSEVLDDDVDSERHQLLNNFPPVLSFFEWQKRKFYDDEARSCQPFCCGGMAYNGELNGDYSFMKQDNYMVSTGSGTLYEGSADDIKKQMQADIYQQSFGSSEQNQMMNGLIQFESIVSERELGVVQSSELDLAPEEKRFNPFMTKPDPTNT